MALSVNTTSLIRDVAAGVVRELRGRGHVAYWAGGCVRDQLLGLVPKDFDVATSATPGEVRGVFRNTQAVGAAFGVILVRVGEVQIEVATFRTDGAYSDGRRPDSVKFASPAEDAQRRDFTINGLFMDPETGEVVDFVGGKADLEARVLRAIGEPADRFAEDHLRMLRAVRFAARFGLRVDPPTALAIQRCAMQLRKISPERVGEEVRRMVVGKTRGEAFELLRGLKLLPEVFRFMDGPDRHEMDLFGLLSPGREVSVALALGAAYLDECFETRAGESRDEAVVRMLGAGSAGEVAKALRQSLRLSNDESDALESMLSWAGVMLGEKVPTLAQKRRFLAAGVSGDAMELLGAIREAGLVAGRLERLMPELEALGVGDNAPPPLLTGDDLVAAGLKPGPGFKRLLEATYDAQLESRLTTREDALTFALAMQGEG